MGLELHTAYELEKLWADYPFYNQYSSGVENKDDKTYLILREVANDFFEDNKLNDFIFLLKKQIFISDKYKTEIDKNNVKSIIFEFER